MGWHIGSILRNYLASGFFILQRTLTVQGFLVGSLWVIILQGFLILLEQRVDKIRELVGKVSLFHKDIIRKP